MDDYSRIAGSLIGLATGDALGVPLEFTRPGESEKVTLHDDKGSTLRKLESAYKMKAQMNILVFDEKFKPAKIFYGNTVGNWRTAGRVSGKAFRWGERAALVEVNSRQLAEIKRVATNEKLTDKVIARIMGGKR